MRKRTLERGPGGTRRRWAAAASLFVTRWFAAVPVNGQRLWTVGGPGPARSMWPVVKVAKPWPEAGALTAAAAPSLSVGFDGAGTNPPAQPARAGAAAVMRHGAGAATGCVPSGPALTLGSGYKVSMCYETYERNVGEGLDWGLDSSQSALLYFFDRDKVEVLIKVLDGCRVNGHRWVFVAPVTDLAFNLVVESPDEKRWTHTNRLGRTAAAASDTSAFPCTA